jgi:hypothetical protein
MNRGAAMTGSRVVPLRMAGNDKNSLPFQFLTFP